MDTAQEIEKFCHLIYQKSYVASTDGNISARLPDGTIMCTPTRCNKGFVKADEMIVIDMKGEVIPGLYCGGESAGGFSMHGLPRAVCQGFIAGRNAVTENR